MASRSWMGLPEFPRCSSWPRLLGACRCTRWFLCRGYCGNGSPAWGSDSLSLWTQPSRSCPGASTTSSLRTCTMGTIWGSRWARAALRFAVADLPLRLGRAEGGTCVREAAPRPSPRHGGDGWVGASLEPAALHCTLGVREASPLGRDQLSAPSSLSSSLFVLATRSQGLGHKVSATGVRSCKGS